MEPEKSTQEGLQSTEGQLPEGQNARPQHAPDAHEQAAAVSEAGPPVEAASDDEERELGEDPSGEADADAAEGVEDDHVLEAGEVTETEVPLTPLLPDMPAVSSAHPPFGRIDGFEAVHSPPKLNHGSPEWLSLEALAEEDTFRIRPEGEVALLATDLARLGQLFPIDVRPMGEGRYQVVCGFRRVAGLKFLHREKVLARVHPDLSDEDALVMALASAIHAAPVSTEELIAAKERFEKEGRLSAATRDMLEKALSPDDDLAPEGVEEEIDADELAADVTMRQANLNQDLALLADVFASLDEARKAELLQQLRYAETLVAYLENR